MTARYLTGDVRKVLATLEHDSVDLVMTSPPFLALRSYLPDDHPDKDLEVGSEPNPGEFIDALLDVVEAIEPVLAPHGSIAFELGDTYAGSGGAGGDYGAGGMREGQPTFSQSKSKRIPKGKDNRWGPRLPTSGDGWPMDKSMCLIPELFRIALAYGRNPLTGRTTSPWRVRNTITWVRPNPPVGALGDKFRPATSDLVIACKSKDRYFDLDAVRAPAKNINDRADEGPTDYAPPGQAARKTTRANNPKGVPPLDWWKISGSGYAGAHFAVYPPELCVRPIKAMCPDRVCTACGLPWITSWDEDLWPLDFGPVCGHDEWRKGVVLDPFAGSGTTLMVAEGHARDSIGIDLDERNLELAHQRVGMFLQVEHPEVT